VGVVGLGVGGRGPRPHPPNPKTPIPNPQSPIKNIYELIII